MYYVNGMKGKLLENIVITIQATGRIGGLVSWVVCWVKGIIFREVTRLRIKVGGLKTIDYRSVGCILYYITL